MARTARLWRIGRWLGGPGRFYFLMLFTVVVVAYAAVPWVIRFAETVGGYNPSDYDPKDLQREDYLRSLPASSEGLFGWEMVLKLLLLVLVGLLWLIAAPGASWRSRGAFRR